MRLGTPVPFDAPDGKPVNLVFVLLVPEQATEQHLQILSELAQMFSDRDLREQLTGDAGRRAPSTSHQPPGSRMLQTSVARLYEDNREKLGL